MWHWMIVALDRAADSDGFSGPTASLGQISRPNSKLAVVPCLSMIGFEML